MRIAALTIALSIVAAGVSPASACIVPPRGQDIFWSHVPPSAAAGDVVLEVRFREYLKPALPKGDNVVVVTSCGSDQSAVYDVVNVLQGEFVYRQVSLVPFTEFPEPADPAARGAHLVVLSGARPPLIRQPAEPASIAEWATVTVRRPPPRYIAGQ